MPWHIAETNYWGISKAPWGTGGGTPEIPWTPADIETVAWFDASDTDTIIESSGAVSQWNDKSGNAHIVKQGTALSQPITGSRQLNGLNVLDFNGSQFLESDGYVFTPPVSGNLSIIMVFKADSINNWSDSVISFFDGAQTNDLQFSSANASQFNGRLAGAVTANFTNGPYSDNTISSLIYDKTNDVFNAYMDSNRILSDLVYSDSSKLGGVGPFKTRIFANRAGNQFPDGLFGEVVMLEDVSTNARQKVEGYLAWKWGLQANLPSDHPYKNGAPTV